ncbi:Bug family tripartite tricarboxylate transporter substrate binding protein [Arthrobacter dokdonensis]|uniref:Bug family tripartite tricarboxylate transporter substrate binding protein n=1 Tax=Arthrobacter dokdonellae TaxID=2211210 RepID=UPI000DE58871|nr:tripartite tricarboxylate transporter substrate-binding protein [Arthrobacter dokdonellae]
MIKRSLRTFATALIICVTLNGCSAFWGESDQLHELSMMVPNTPGGGYDIAARTVTNIMEKTGTTGHIDVFNVVGDDETIAMERLLKESGNANLMMMMGLGMVGACYGSVSNCRPSDATALALLTEEPEVVVVPADSPYKSIADLISAWKADPVSLKVGGGSSRGGPNYLFPMELAHIIGIATSTVKYVPFAGDGQMLPALLNHRIAFGATGFAEYRDQITAGQLRVLAVSAKDRTGETLAPTLKEAGIDLVFMNWHGVLAPPGISAEDRARLIDILTKLHQSQQWKQALVDNEWTDVFITGDAFAQFLKQQERLEAATMKQLGFPAKA